MEVAVSPIGTVVGFAKRADPSPLPPIEKIATHIQAIYDSGRPFYTKELLQNIKQQLQDARDGLIQTIRVPGLDGVIVEFPVLTGKVYPAQEPGMEFIIRTPCIEYSSLQGLLATAGRRADYSAYAHIKICHYKFLRSIQTKQLYSNLSVYSVPEASEFLRSSSQIWENSAQCQELRKMLMARRTVGISKIVGLALGSFATDRPFVQSRPAYQHALLLTLRDIYCKMHAVGQDAIQCLAQDPVCNTVDISVAREAGITILNDPDGFLEIDDSAVVVSCAPDVPVRQIVFDLAQPAVLIWNTVKEDDYDYMADPTSPRVRALIQEFYDELPFPDYNDYFGDLAIYIRRC